MPPRRVPRLPDFAGGARLRADGRGDPLPRAAPWGPARTGVPRPPREVPPARVRGNPRHGRLQGALRPRAAREARPLLSLGGADRPEGEPQSPLYRSVRRAEGPASRGRRLGDALLHDPARGPVHARALPAHLRGEVRFRHLRGGRAAIPLAARRADTAPPPPPPHRGSRAPP